MPEQENKEQENKVTLTWVLFGILAVVIMWALSSLLFK